MIDFPPRFRTPFAAKKDVSIKINAEFAAWKNRMLPADDNCQKEEANINE